MIFRKLTYLILLLSLVLTVGRSQAQPNIVDWEIGSNPTNSPVLNWSVIFDQAVTGVSVANFSTAGTGVTGTVNSVSPSLGNMRWNINVTGVTGTGTLGVNLDNPAGIMGTTAPLVATSVGDLYDVDNTEPFVVSITRADASPTSASTVGFLVTFSEIVNNVTAINFAPGGSLTGTVGGISTADGIVWRVDVSGISGSGTVKLDLTDTSNIRDLAGNQMASDYIGSDIYLIDQDGPQLVCITRLDDSPTSASSVNFQVEFNEPAFNLTAANFTVNGAGTSGTISAVTSGGSGTTWTVTVSGILGSGTLTVDLTNASGIVDALGNVSVSTGPGCESYNIDRVNPEVVSIARGDASPTSSTVVTFIVTFSEDVTNGALTDFSVGGTAAGFVSAVTTSGSVTVVTVSGATGPGDLCLVVNSPSTITDLLGNPLINIPVYGGSCYFICIDPGPIGVLYPQDGETTVTTADNIAWTPPAPNIGYDVYFDGAYLDTTTATYYAIPGPLTPGQHSYRVEVDGGCTSGTEVFFNALDAPGLVFPLDGYQACLAPRAFSWLPVDGATTYTLEVNGINVATTTDTFAKVNLSYLASGWYGWRVFAQNEFGVQPSIYRSFYVNGSDPVSPTLFNTNGTIYSMRVDSSFNVIIGGEFTQVQDRGVTWTLRNNIAAFDGFTGKLLDWAPDVNGAVYSLESNFSRLYIGGNFTMVEGIARGRVAAFPAGLTTTTVTSFRPGANGTVRAMELVGNSLFYGGDFTKVGEQVYNFANPGIDCVRVASADITTTQGLVIPNLNPNASVRDLLYDGSNLYVAGVFSQIGGQAIRGLAQTNFVTTQTIELEPTFDQQLDLYAYSLYKANDVMYIGGSFNSIKGQPRMNVAALRFESTTGTVLMPWNPRTDSAVHSVSGTGKNSLIYIGGTFTTVDQQRNTYLAGVDPVVGLPATCSFNADRIIYATDVQFPFSVNANYIFAGGQATGAGADAP